MQTLAAIKRGIFPQSSSQKIFGLIKTEMALVEAEFERQAVSNIQVLSYLGEYLRASGGKRVRPALLTLSNYAVGGDGKSERSIRLATVMEMLHTATLVHDDIIDNALIRRNRPSFNERFGNQMAVLMGDWLYMSAFETSLEARSLEILDILTRLTRKMTEGELIQLTQIGSAAITEDEYFDILRRKTAYLFAGCCEIGAILGGGSLEVQSALREYGMNLGIAFQLADDLLDFTASEKTLGKAAGADILEGKLTLPLIIFLREDPSITPLLNEIMTHGSDGKRAHSDLISRLAANGALDKVRSIALRFAANARKNLEILPESEYRFALGEIPNFVIDRNS